MSISRRGFFGLLAAGVAVTPQLADLLVPKRTIFLPPKGGWRPNLLTVRMIHDEALKVLCQNMEFMTYCIPRMYDDDFMPRQPTNLISIRKSARYDVRVDAGPMLMDFDLQQA